MICRDENFSDVCQGTVIIITPREDATSASYPHAGKGRSSAKMRFVGGPFFAYDKGRIFENSRRHAMRVKKWTETVCVYDVNGKLKKEMEKGDAIVAVTAFRLSKIPNWQPVSLPHFLEVPRRGGLIDIAIDDAFVLYGCTFLSDRASLLPQKLEEYAARHRRTFWTLVLPEALGKTLLFIDPELAFDARKR